MKFTNKIQPTKWQPPVNAERHTDKIILPSDLFLSRTILSEILQTNKQEHNSFIRIGTFCNLSWIPLEKKR